jgi:hypothetical protein
MDGLDARTNHLITDIGAGFAGVCGGLTDAPDDDVLEV